MEPLFTYGDLSITLVELILGVALILLGAIIALFFSQFGAKALRRHLSDMSDKHAALQGRLAQMAEDSVKRETVFRESLDARLDKVSQRVGQSLNETQERSSQNLKQLHERLVVIDRAQKNIEALTGEVSGLQRMLSNKQSRGTFGEKQMQDMIADFLPPNSFRFQETLSNHKRVDALIDLPNDQGSLAIDSKFPLESWRRMDGADTEFDRKSAERDFIRDIKAHVKAISEKYLIPGETHDIALLFLPSEAIYLDLHTHFQQLIDDSFQKRVMIVSPTSFMATLHTIRAVMRDAQMREQAHIIQKEVGEMSKDVDRLDQRVAKLQTHFNQTTEDMRNIRISTEKITKRSERIESLDLEDNTSDLLPDRGTSQRQVN
ncbi:MAG: DNA recombination protein RmuC [Maricaulaceae bacterium]